MILPAAELCDIGILGIVQRIYERPLIHVFYLSMLLGFGQDFLNSHVQIRNHVCTLIKLAKNSMYLSQHTIITSFPTLDFT